MSVCNKLVDGPIPRNFFLSELRPFQPEYHYFLVLLEFGRSHGSSYEKYIVLYGIPRPREHIHLLKHFTAKSSSTAYP